MVSDAKAINEISPEETISPEVQQIMREFPDLFKSERRVKVDKIQDDVFIQPTVITGKNDKSVKITLDARVLNESIAKDKYQMPNLGSLIDMIAEESGKSEGEAWYSSVDDLRLRADPIT